MYVWDLAGNEIAKLPLIAINCLVPYMLKQPQDIIKLPPCLNNGTVFFGRKVLPFLHQIFCTSLCQKAQFFIVLVPKSNFFGEIKLSNMTWFVKSGSSWSVSIQKQRIV